MGVFLIHRDNTRLSQNNQRLLSENRRLQQDYGEFVVEDPSKVHAVALASNDAGNAWQWRWRVFVPEDAAYQLNVATGVIAAGGFPKPQSSPPLQPGDNFVSYSIYHNGSEWRQAYRITRGDRIGLSRANLG